MQPHLTTDDLILDAGTKAALNIDLFGRIEHADRLEDLGMKFQNGVLLAGPPGTGKTLTGHAAASLCEANGITFVNVVNAKDLRLAVQIVGRWNGKVVMFVEDIDELTGGKRDSDMNAILNSAMDGISTKGKELILVATTNCAEKLTNVSVRAGRTNGVIFFEAPSDPATIREFLLHYSKDANGEPMLVGELSDELLKAISQEAMIPSFLEEIMRKAKMWSYLEKEPITENAIYLMLEAIGPHLEMFRAASSGQEEDNLEKALGVIIEAAISQFGLIEFDKAFIETARRKLAGCAIRG